MQRQIIFPAALLALNAAGALGQGATTTSSPLNEFLDGVQSGAGAINSAISAQSSSSSTSSPSSSSTTPTAAPATSSAAPAPTGGLSNGAKIGIIVGCVVAAVLLIGLLAGICCCLMRRKRRRSRAVTPIPDEEVKSWKSKPMNPGRNYSPVATHGRSPSMEQHPTMPLMAASAIPHGSHSQAPSLSQHPAMRNQNENPFADNAYETHRASRNSHHGIGAPAAGATAAGAAAYGMHKHHQANSHQPGSHAQPIAQHQHHGLPPGVATATVGNTAGHSIQHNHPVGGQQPVSNAKPIAQNQHHGLPPGVASATVGAASGHGTQHHTTHTSQPSSNTYMTPSNHNGLNPQSSAASMNSLNTLPSANHPSSTTHNGLMGAAAGTAAAGAVGYGAHCHGAERRIRDESRSRSGSRSRPHSDGLPTHNNTDRPPTPFGLSGIGQPYEDMHVHVLQSEAPSRELRHSLHRRENAPLATGVYDDSDHTKYPSSHGEATPPHVPSRSPNREKRASTFANSSYESSVSNGASTSSNSGGEQYQQTADPYQPANPSRGAVAPWEQHQTRYSGTPPTSAAINPPPVPWDQNEYARQRRNSHSPRQSRASNGFTDVNGRRSSGSPATSINGQARRLRFEDLQAGNGNNRYSGVNQRDSYDGYDQARWSQGVGEAL